MMSFRPSKHSLTSPGNGIFVLRNPALTKKECDAADADHKKYLDKMWKTPILTPDRKKYEDKAIAAQKVSKDCVKAGIGGRGVGYPKMSVPKLWQSDPKKRDMDVGLVISAVMAGPEILDVVTAAVKGWHPSLAMSLEWRGEIAGGLLTLQRLGEKGYENVDRVALQKLVALTLSKKDNEKLLKMAAESGDSDTDLERAARNMRAKVAKFGDAAMTYAFGTRGLLMCSAGSVAQALQSTVKSGILIGVAFIPIVGVPIALIVGGVNGLKAAIAVSLSDAAKAHMDALVSQAAARFQVKADIKLAESDLKTAQALEKLQRDQAAAIARMSAPVAAPPKVGGGPPFTQHNALLWGGLAAAVLTGVVLVARSRSSE